MHGARIAKGVFFYFNLQGVAVNSEFRWNLWTFLQLLTIQNKSLCKKMCQKNRVFQAHFLYNLE